ncbi:MAG: hypothetical protein J5611_01845 [Alphaproteobacteria bacterium]|nr:hypothetical protein [Alphaproteobacteria bacterium]
MRKILLFVFSIFVVFQTQTTIAFADAEEQETTETEPDEEKVATAKQSQKEYELAREKEKAGRVNAGLSTLATGLGGYAAASSYFEQEADKKAEEDMRDYLSHMYCNYSGGGVASLGETVEIPGGDELFAYYNEYRNLANNLKQTKAALNLTPGLEAQVVYENSNLYQYSSRTPRSGSTASLARALIDKDSEDAAAWNAQKEETAKDLRTGALVAAGGLAFGISNRIALDQKSEDNDNKKPKYEDYNQYKYKYLNTASVNENIDCKVQNIEFVNQLAVTGTGGFANCDKERKEQHCGQSLTLTESGECAGRDSSDPTTQYQYNECVRCKDILQRLSDCNLELDDYCLRKYGIDRHKIVRDKQGL